MTSDFPAGNYRFIPAVFQYSGGVAALLGLGETDAAFASELPARASVPGRYHGGDWQGIIDHLDYLQELGVSGLPRERGVSGGVLGSGGGTDAGRKQAGGLRRLARGAGWKAQASHVSRPRPRRCRRPRARRRG